MSAMVNLQSPRTGRAAPFPPLTAAHFVPVALNGFGDPENTYSHSMGWYRGCLYVGATRNALCGGRPYDRTKHYHIYPIKVPDVPWDLDWRAQIWRYQPPPDAAQPGRWKMVHVSPLVMGTKGFEIPRHYGFRDMTVFQGKSDTAPVLYATSWGSHMGPGPFVLRCEDGETFEEVGVEDRALFGNQTLRSLIPFKGRLFTSPTGRCGGVDTSHDDMVVLETDDPRRGGWRPASEQFFGDRSNVTVFDLAVFDDRLYAGTMNPFHGYQIWRTDGEGDPPYRWDLVLSSGAFRGKLNEAGLSFCEFEGALYVGSGIYHCGYDQIYKVGPGAPELIRIWPDGSWDLLVGEPRYTPQGLKVPLSGLGPGFNNPFSGYLWRLCAHDGWLYAATCVWTPWLPFSRYERMLEIVQKILDPERMEKLLRDFGGFGLWRSRDGRHWAPVTVNGFGNHFNCGVRSMVSSPHGLFVGTVNQFGPEVAVRRAAGWRYELNTQAGTEVWLGSHRPPPPGRPHGLLSGEGRTAGDPAVEIEVRTAEPDLIQELYGHGGWRQVGYWGSRIGTAAEACRNLLEELHAFTVPDPPLKAPRYPGEEEFRRWMERRRSGLPAAGDPAGARGAILDIGPTTGATTLHIQERWGGAEVVGACDDREALALCRASVPRAAFSAMKLPRLKHPAGRFEIAVCVEGPGRWGDRPRLLAEVLRVLRPGGRLVAADMVFEEEGPGEPDGYARVLERIGFVEIRIIDVTQRTIHPFREHAEAFFQLRVLSGKADAGSIQEAMAALPGGSGPVPRYLLVSARKPPLLPEGRKETHS